MSDALGTPGRVYLVGAGPGDPGLLTLRGRDLLAAADLVVYDSLVNEELLRHAPHAEHIFVGKRPDQHPLQQEDINRLLVEQAAKRERIVRLKGGDPFVFGRGGEEALALVAAGISFEVVSGVSAGHAAPAYAGIPVTHRGIAGGVTFLTGHNALDSDSAALRSLPVEGTIVFFMGVSNLDTLLRAVRDHAGRSGDTPAAAIEWGTLPRQRTIMGTVDTLARACREAELASPAIIVVGPVVALRDQLAWFEERPLFGKRVAVTRARERSAALTTLLRDYGADVFELPTVQILSAPEAAPLGDPASFDWVVLMSVNAIDTLLDRLAAEGRDIRALQNLRICAVSERAQQRLSELHVRPDLAPEGYDTVELVAQMERQGSLATSRVLLPRADIGRSALPAALREAGAEVVEVQAYRTAIPPDAEALGDALVRFAPDYVTLTSASAARNLPQVLGAARWKSVTDSAAFAAIGPVAAEAAIKAGCDRVIVPERHTIPDLVAAIVDHASS